MFTKFGFQDKTNINVLIVDDNKIARTIVNQLCSQVKEIIVTGECQNAIEAYNFIKENQIDLIFLDIEMPGMSGMELIKNITDNKPVIIFTTAKKEYAVDAFELNVADFIVKPVTLPRLINAIEKAKDLIHSRRENVKLKDDEFIFIRDSNVVRQIKLDDILYVEAMGDYVKLHTSKKYFAIHNTLKSVESKLPDDKFIRVHRSFIINISKIDMVKEGALIIDNIPVPVADAYRCLLNSRMNVL